MFSKIISLQEVRVKKKYKTILIASLVTIFSFVQMGYIALAEDQDSSPLGTNNEQNVSDAQGDQSVSNAKADFVLTNDDTGEVVKTWSLGEENKLVSTLQAINTGASADGSMPPSGTHTLTLNANLVLPSTMWLQHNQNLTFQSAEGKKFSMSLGKISQTTPVYEELIACGDSCDDLNLTFKNIILDGKNKSRGIEMEKGTTLKAEDCIFQNFTKPSDRYSAGMTIFALKAKGLIINNCVFENNDAIDKSAACIATGQINDCKITQTTFKNNKAKNAAAIFFYGTKATVDKCTFDSNVSTDKDANAAGGAISLSRGADITIANSEFIKNEASNGGAIRLNNGCRLKIDNSKFNENKANKGTAGAILAIDNIQINKSTFSNNQALNSGGAISQYYGALQASNTIFDGNKAGEYGGAIMLMKDAQANIGEKTAFTNNSCGNQGGAIFDDKYSYEDPADASTGYTNLKTDKTVRFDGNSAPYFSNPPKNYQDFNWINFSKTSFTGLKNPDNQEPLLRNDFPLNNYDVNYISKTEFADVTFEYKSRDSKQNLPEVIKKSCRANMQAPIGSFVMPSMPETKEFNIDGQNWKFDIWVPSVQKIKKENNKFTGYWYQLQNIKVKKVWEDDKDKEGKRPKDVIIRLIADGKITNKQIILNADGKWEGSFKDLDDYNKGKKVIYSVKEEELDKKYKSSVKGDPKDGFVITNKYQIAKKPEPQKPNTKTPHKDKAPSTGDNALELLLYVTLLLTFEVVYLKSRTANIKEKR